MPARLTALGAPHIGSLPAGALDAITDVQGVRVGHCTLADGAVQTGATVVLPHSDNLFMHKLPAAVDVINGFGKSAGLMQVQELGSLESLIALVSTLSVGTATTALVRDALSANPRLARELPTVNALVMECNDGWLNDARALPLSEDHVRQALFAARQSSDAAPFDQGSVGAGRGMSCHGLKGGIGSASRVIKVEGRMVTVGVLVLANQGRADALILNGARVGAVVAQRQRELDAREPERGSIIIIVATDAPLDARQLGRVARRSAAGLARTGSDYGHGSGDVALAFSTAYRIPQQADAYVPPITLLHESRLDPLFQATADATEQAIVHALFAATTVTGRDGHTRRALRDVLADWADFMPAAKL